MLNFIQKDLDSFTFFIPHLFALENDEVKTYFDRPDFPQFK